MGTNSAVLQCVELSKSCRQASSSLSWASSSARARLVYVCPWDMELRSGSQFPFSLGHNRMTKYDGVEKWTPMYKMHIAAGVSSRHLSQPLSGSTATGESVTFAQQLKIRALNSLTGVVGTGIVSVAYSASLA